MENVKQITSDEYRKYVKFTDDFFFSRVMQNPTICRMVVKAVLGLPVADVVIHQTQDTLKREHDTHGIRVDVHLETPREVVVLEMQLSAQSALFWRMRYYQGILDTAQLPQGQEYITLKESYIIFFCSFDPVGLGLPVYTVRQCYEEKREKIYNDGTHKVLYNMSAWDKCNDPDVRALLYYMDTGDATNELTQTIDRALKEEQRIQQWRNNFMTYQIMLDSRLEQAVNQRLEQAVNQRLEGRVEQRIAEVTPTLIAQGQRDKAIDTAKNLLLLRVLSPNQIAEATGLSVEEVLSLS